LSHRVSQAGTVDTWNLLLVRRIDLREPEPVSLLEAARQSLQKPLRARKAVWLKSDQQPAMRQRLQSAQGGFNFGGVMTIVVIDAKAIIGKKQVLASGHSAEGLQGCSNPCRSKPKPMQ
jgi:hypothetical protein